VGISITCHAQLHIGQWCGLFYHLESSGRIPDKNSKKIAMRKAPSQGYPRFQTKSGVIRIAREPGGDKQPELGIWKIGLGAGQK